METFPALLAICVGNSPVTDEFPAKASDVRALIFFICAWINGWVNDREAGDLRRHRAHYYVILMQNWAVKDIYDNIERLIFILDFDWYLVMYACQCLYIN